MSNKGSRRVRFNNTRTSVTNALPTPAYITGFNRTNPYSLAEGWQTQAERIAAAKHARAQNLYMKSLGQYKEPYAYQDPHFIYPKEARKNMAAAATQYAAMNRAAESLKELLNQAIVKNHVAIHVKPTSRRRTRRRHRN